MIQEIARSKDRPEDRADELIDLAAFGDHPLGRPVLGTEERLRAFTRDDVIAFRERRWCRQRGCALLVGNLDHLPSDRELDRLLERFPAARVPEPYAAPPAPSSEVIVEETDSHHSHLRLLYRPEIDFDDRRMRAALAVYRTLLGGSQGSLLFEELRERRGLAYSTTALEAVSSDTAILQIDAGLESEQCPAAHELIRELVLDLAREGPDRDHVDRARSYAAGRRVLAFENSNVLADHLAQEAILHGGAGRPEEEIAVLDAVGYDEVADVAGRIGDAPAVACVGPHTTADFS